MGFDRKSSHQLSRPPYRGHGRIAARAIGSFLPGLTRKVFEKYGFSTADLLTNWPEIVGDELARHTAPQRLKWPRQYDETASSEANEGRNRQRSRPQGATLLLMVDGGRALDVQYQARQIVERVNAFFGYRAIAAIKILQGPIAAQASDMSSKSKPLALPKAVLSQHRTLISGIEDDGLREALERLGAQVAAKSASKPAAG